MPRSVHTLIIGGGAAGLMCAAQLRGRAPSPSLFDGNIRIGAKISVSGGGRCNVTNRTIETSRYRGDSNFIEPVFRRYDNRWLTQWLERGGVPLRCEKQGQYFCREGAESLVQLFAKRIEGVDLHLGEAILSVEGAGPFLVRSTKEMYRADNLVIASGGLSFPRLGASELGLQIAKQYGHRIVRPAPALVGLTLQREQFFMKELSGISLPVRIGVGERFYRDQLLFAHKGISGPAVLNASLWWEKGEICIDFLPGFDLSGLSGSKKLSTLLPMPRRASRAFLEHLGVEDRPAHRLSGRDRQILAHLQAYRFSPAGTFGYSKAEVTRGGVATGEVDPTTMMSRRIPGLYFLGEVLDVTGELGGYNFQWAFSSAAICADALAGSPSN